MKIKIKEINILDVVFTTLVTYMWTFANIDWQRYSYAVDIAPFTWRVAWRALIFPVEFFVGTKIASLFLFVCFFFCIMVLTSNFNEKILLVLIFMVGSLNFMYISDSLVVLSLILIRKFPNSRFAILGALIKEDVLIFLMVFNNRKSRFLAIPLWICIRLLFNADYQAGSKFLTIFNYINRLNVVFWGILIVVVFWALAYILSSLSHESFEARVFIPAWVILMILFGNFWEVNKHITIFYAVKNDKTIGDK